MKKLPVILMFVVVCSVTTFSQSTDAQTLHDWWQAYQRLNLGTASAQDSNYADFYIGYVDGVWDTILSMQAAKVISTPFVDTNTTGKMGQVYAIVGKYLDDHPEQWSWPGAVLTMGAIHQAFSTH